MPQFERLTQFLINNNYSSSNIDKTLFIKSDKYELFIAQIYVYDIVFGSTNDSKVKQFVDVMFNEFEMSMVDELTYFLGLQIMHMNTTLKLSKVASGKSVDQSLYRGMIDS